MKANLICNIFCGIAAFVFVAIGWAMLDRSAVITFGDPEKSFLKMITDESPERPLVIPEFAAGDKVKICFQDIQWFRLIPSVGYMSFIDSHGIVYNYDKSAAPIAVHKISMATKIGPLPPKCRIAEIPAGLPAGKTILTGTFVSTDTFLGVLRVVTIPYPRMEFVMKATK